MHWETKERDRRESERNKVKWNESKKGRDVVAEKKEGKQKQTKSFSLFETGKCKVKYKLIL